MMKAYYFLLAALVCGYVLTAPAPVTDNAINWDKFKVKDFKSIIDVQDKLYLVHFTLGECKEMCEADKQLLSRNLEMFKNLESSLELKTVELNEKVAKKLRIKEESSIYLFYKGVPMRVDHHGSKTTFKKTVEQSIINILVNQPEELETVDDAKAAFESDYIYIFYGDHKSNYWGDIELTSKLVDPKIYFTSSKEVAREFNLDSRGFIYCANLNKEKTFQMKDRPDHSHAINFVHMTSNKFPMDFEQTVYQEALESGTNMIFYQIDSEVDLAKVFDDNDHLFKSHFYVFRLTNPKDATQKAIIDRCTDPSQDSNNVFCIMEDDLVKGVRYIYGKDDFTEKQLIKWIIKFLNGKLKPYYKSSPIDQEFSGKVKNLNADSFVNFVAPKRDDLSFKVVMYYDSKTPEDRYTTLLEEVADQLDSTKVIVGKLDIDANDPVVHAPAGLYFNSHVEVDTVFAFDESWDVEHVKAWIEKIAREEDEYFEKNMDDIESDL